MMATGRSQRFSQLRMGARVAVRPPLPTFASDADRSLALAPDLRFTRDRYRPDALAQWVVNPRALKPDTRMPNLGLTPSDAADVATFILTAHLDPPVHPAREEVGGGADAVFDGDGIGTAVPDYADAPHS